MYNLGVKKQLMVLTASAFLGRILVFGVSVVQIISCSTISTCARGQE